MSTPKWHEQPLVAFDTETTGTDPTTARIVTAAAVHMAPGQRPRPIRWLIDPQVDIPTAASDVHGYTNDRIHQLLAEHGGHPGQALRVLNGHIKVIPADVAVFELVAQVAATGGRDQALVVHNAPYDLTLAEHEAARYDVAPLSARPRGAAGVVDPMVIEKAYDPYRKTCYKKAPDGTACDQENRVHVCGGCRGGKTNCAAPGCGSTDKTLTSLCAHYGVLHAGAHDCADDAVATVRLLRKLVAAWPQMASYKLSTLHEKQVGWRAEQQDGLRKFFDRVGKDHDGCCGSWPLHTAACTAAHRAEAVAA